MRPNILGIVPWLVMAILSLACVPDCDRESHESSEKPVHQDATQIGLSSFSHVGQKFENQLVDDFQIIDKENALLLGDFTSLSEDCFLQVVGPDGLRPFELNAELSKLGKLLAISDVIDNHVVVALSQMSKTGDKDLPILAVINLDTNSIVSLHPLKDHQAEPMFDSSLRPAMFTAEDIFEWDSYYLLRTHSIQLRLIDRYRLAVAGPFRGSSKLFLMNLETGSIVKTLLVPYVEDSVLFPRGFKLAVDRDRSITYLAMTLNAKETLATSRVFPELRCIKNSNSSSTLIWAIDDGGTVISCAALDVDDADMYSVNALDVNGHQLIIGGSRRVKDSLQSSFIASFEFDFSQRLLLQKWVKSLEKMPADSNYVNAVASGANGRIFVGGMSGFRQAKTSSVIQAGDAFLFALDGNGDLIASRHIAQQGSDLLVKLKVHDGGLYMLTQENMPLTHEANPSPYFSRLYKVNEVF